MTERPRAPSGAAGPSPAAGHPSDDTLNDLLDGRLPPDERARVRAHVESCARCRADHDALAGVIALGARVRTAGAPPPDVWPLVAATTIHEHRVRRHVLRTMRVPLLVGALVIAIVSAWLGVLAGRSLAARDAGPAGAAGAGLGDDLDAMAERERRAQQQRDATLPPAR